MLFYHIHFSSPHTSKLANRPATKKSGITSPSITADRPQRNKETSMATVRQQSSASSLGNYVWQADAKPELENRPLDFCNAFWGFSDPGVEVLFARMSYAAKTIEDLRAFWRERLE